VINKDCTITVTGKPVTYVEQVFSLKLMIFLNSTSSYHCLIILSKGTITSILTDFVHAVIVVVSLLAIRKVLHLHFHSKQSARTVDTKKKQ